MARLRSVPVALGSGRHTEPRTSHSAGAIAPARVLLTTSDDRRRASELDFGGVAFFWFRQKCSPAEGRAVVHYNRRVPLGARTFNLARSPHTHTNAPFVVSVASSFVPPPFLPRGSPGRLTLA